MNPCAKAFYQTALLALLAAVLGAPAQAAQPPSQTTVHETLTITAEVVAVDQATRHLTLRGPLGGEISGRVDDAVKNLGQVKVGDMLTISYQSSMALSAAKPGQPNPLFTGGEASTAEEGERPAVSVSEQSKHTVTVVSVDPEKRSVVLQSEDGTLFPVEVARAEFARKLEALRPGDKIDVVLTDAMIVKVDPAPPGAKAGMSYTASTLIIERGEVLWRSGNTILVRDERGRTVKVTVDPKFKFMVNGKEATVADLKPGTKLTRTALRTEKVESE
ncbi:MAG TPA: hypothetical protein VF789_02665 [Thermoanaerobaculia bacterium]